ncbi:heat shock protein HslJ [Parabacteroides sp. PFB2-12]|uniref:META domain-containing protein n=1 Tax=unclassified Parabacteroides TaxID=2649774 RepID=UPI0024752C47|nr:MULTISPECIES: META domain-containing protein [unclassified Parabacteroides]MDH6343417.1 heat shock protein HslJ [Parabacteroides sp. PM6-13]MDH6391991.1 heat shock protein HslJ [Parabacteroides sp. PFB2-12]
MKTKKATIVLFLASLLSLFALPGCGVSQQAIKLNDLEGEWVLKTINGREVSTSFSKSLPTLQFDFKEKLIHGSGGCNRYSTRFVLVNNHMTTSPVVSTRMMCLDPNIENEFFRALETESWLFIKKGILTFRNEKNAVVMEFQPKREKLILAEK